MKTVVLLIFGLSLLDEGFQALQIKAPMIDVSLPECDPRRDSLFCDFLDSDTDIIHLDNRNGTIGKIYIYNIAELHLSQPLCTNLALNSIGRVEIVDRHPDACDKKIKIAAKDTQFSIIPENVKEIDLENCSLSSLTLSSFFTKVHILNSHIEVLNTSQPLTNTTSFQVLGSSIGRLENFVLEGCEFSMKHTQIDLISRRGLEVKQGAVKIENCSFKNVSDDSFIIHPNANLILKNISGNFFISNGIKQRSGRPFIVENNEDKKIYTTEFIILLSALVITTAASIGLIFIHFIKKKTNSYLKKRDDGSRNTSIHQSGFLKSDEISETENEQNLLVNRSCISVDDNTTQFLENWDTRMTQSSISSSGCMATSNGMAKTIDDTLLTEPRSLSACRQSKDKLVDNVIVIHSYPLNEREKNSMAYALRKDRIKIVLKKTTYKWNEVERELLARNPRLCDFPVIKIPTNENITNGQNVTSMNRTVSCAIRKHEENKRRSKTSFTKATTSPGVNVDSRSSRPAGNPSNSTRPKIAPSRNKRFSTEANKLHEDVHSYDSVKPGSCKGTDIPFIDK
ncbi:uncharacterized protein [Palaemon carinicauda]|uniref:uncharacterized protein n=1 Tax=Palaemon carinicauda TaxID=392227 RepID=UPI0035B61E81